MSLKAYCNTRRRYRRACQSNAVVDFSLKIVDPLRYPHWDELLLEQPSYLFFHSSAWARILSESYRYRPLYFTKIDQGRLSVLVPLMEVKSVLTGCRAVGLPFTDYCQPVIPPEENHQDVLDEILLFGKQAGWNSIEIRTNSERVAQFPSSSSYSVHSLDLTPGPDALFRKFRDSTRRNIKKAMKEGVSVSFHTSPESIAAFYALNCVTRKEHGLPPQPYLFFKNIHEYVISRDLGFVALASYNGRNIAGAVFLYSRDNIIYKYGASLRSYQHLRANNLLMCRAIQWCSEKGSKSLCFGRTELNNTGLRRFKAGWGGEEKIIDYYRYDLNKDAFVRSNSWGSGMHTAIWKHIPIPLSKIAGRMLYRHVG